MQIQDKRVAAAFAALPAEFQGQLKTLRGLIFEVASQTEGVGRIEETLKWGQPSYLTPETKSGSTVRLGCSKSKAHAAIYFHCQTNILTSFQDMFPDEFRYEGNRAILFSPDEDIQADKLRLCIAHALTYHLRK